MTGIQDKRRAIRHLLREDEPADAMAAYYALHHPDDTEGRAVQQDLLAKRSLGSAEQRIGILPPHNHDPRPSLHVERAQVSAHQWGDGVDPGVVGNRADNLA